MHKGKNNCLQYIAEYLDFRYKKHVGDEKKGKPMVFIRPEHFWPWLFLGDRTLEGEPLTSHKLCTNIDLVF